MIEVFSDNIFVMFCGLFFQQTVGIPMDTTCAPPLLADLFLYCYLDIKQGLLKKNEKTFVPSLNFTLHYTDDVISLYNSMLCDFIVRIYPIELVINDIPYTDRSASFLDLHIEIEWWPVKNETLGQKRLFQFSHCEISIYLKKHDSSTCIWGYISLGWSDILEIVDPIRISDCS
jgi:hypothetical protein